MLRWNLESARLKDSLSNENVKAWRQKVGDGPLKTSFDYLEEVDAERLRKSCSEEDLKRVENHLAPLIEAAKSASKDAPHDAKQISTDKQLVDTAEEVIKASKLTEEAVRTENLISFLNVLEGGIREEIRERSALVIDEISESIQRMWEVLHPDERIDDVHLYVPDSTNKAIDIGLRFYGVDQDSPRLTLSEGFRNSLGLCIFLSMAKAEAGNDRPLFLDDVVVSLDRNHRGMIAELLEKEFVDRQVVILTHDRTWFTELRQQLDSKEWRFGVLLPYKTPEVGIRWSDTQTSFDDARAHLDERPDSAGNDSRKIMDVELALIAERLKIKLPYLHGHRNDRRTSHDFLHRIIADGKKCFQKKVGDEYVIHTDAIEAFEKADRLLISWANRGSHSFDVVQSEANKLIDACEEVLTFFRCPSCDKRVWYAEAANPELVQCNCGELRWRYGKA